MNPFSTCFVRSDRNQYRFAADELHHQILRSQFINSLTSSLDQHHRVAIVGQHGTGKSTLLGNVRTFLEEQFECIQWLRLTSEPQVTKQAIRKLFECLERSGSSTFRCVIIDGYEQLGWWDRLRLSRAASGNRDRLLITSHQDHRGFMTIHRTAWDDQVAQLLTTEKLSGLAPSVQAELLANFLAKVNESRNHYLNLRELWFMMYDDVERLRRDTRTSSPANLSACDACSS